MFNTDGLVRLYVYEGRNDNAFSILYFCKFADEQEGEDLSPISVDRDINMSMSCGVDHFFASASLGWN